MIYSPHPHRSYLDAEGQGPGARYLGDNERWNWRYAVIGTEVNEDFDQALVAYFNDAQRKLMQQEPALALEFFRSHLPTLHTPAMVERLTTAQAAVVAGTVQSVVGNVINVKFG